MIGHFAWTDTQQGALYTPFGLLEILLCGGWRVDVVTQAMQDVFADEKIGKASLQSFAGAVMRTLNRRQQRIGVDWFALGYCSVSVREAITDWINALAGSEEVVNLATDPAVQDQKGSLQGFAGSAGQFDVALMPGPH